MSYNSNGNNNMDYLEHGRLSENPANAGCSDFKYTNAKATMRGTKGKKELEKLTKNILYFRFRQNS